ncbi:NADH-quinone oxidoreductase subunit C [Oleiharenicola lentus]|uniref:NADH-quinone oxidoreductase subunit C n=1 Tax=Oleiharenicola lentus TaxID=2508720 RepID=UPI003F67FB57
MSTDVEVTTAVSQQFPAVSPRASLDCPAFNVPADEALALLKYLRDTHAYDFLVDVTAIDWSAEQSPRFTVVWHLYSSTSHNYIRIAADCMSDPEPSMPSAVGIWPGADWHERETYDMFGIKFEGHPDLRRILMWDGYPYFPLRKEFPLAGLPAELPDVEVAAETKTGVISAPMAGGPFVATPGEPMSEAEPRAKDEAWNEQREKPL